MYKLVIFDFDGALADRARWLASELNGLSGRFGFRPVTDSEMERLQGCDERSILRRLGTTVWQRPLIARQLRRRLDQDAERIQLFPGAKALLRRLAGAGVVLGVVSSYPAAYVRRILGAEAAALIEHYHCGPTLFGRAARLRRLVKRARVRPCDSFCIGHERQDIEAARQAGLACGAVAWGHPQRELLAELNATWVFDTPDEAARRLAA